MSARFSKGIAYEVKHYGQTQKCVTAVNKSNPLSIHVTGAQFIKRQCPWFKDWGNISRREGERWFTEWKRQANGFACDRVIFYDGQTAFCPCAWDDRDYLYMDVDTENVITVNDELWEDGSILALKSYQGQK